MGDTVTKLFGGLSKEEMAAQKSAQAAQASAVAIQQSKVQADSAEADQALNPLLKVRGRRGLTAFLPGLSDTLG